MCDGFFANVRNLWDFFVYILEAVAGADVKGRARVCVCAYVCACVCVRACV